MSSLPVVTDDAGGRLDVLAGGTVTLRVTVVDPNGDAVSLRLLDPEPGIAAAPIVNQPSPQTMTIRWFVSGTLAYSPRLRFVANDATAPTTVVTHDVVARFAGPAFQSVVTGDVTGDGRADVVARALGADVGGVGDTGALYLFAGAVVPVGAPTATLTVPGAFPTDQLGISGVQLVDVTGDGVLDVVTGSFQADTIAATDVGAAYVWKGGATLTGAVAPTATLQVVGAFAGDHLGGILAGDVTGDGTTDLVVGARDADSLLAEDVGAIYVWRGGATLSGAPLVTATLTVPGAVTGDNLGQSNGQGTFLADVSGDGVLDVVSAATGADVGGVVNAGAVYVWNGGAGLTGALAPTATLTVPGALPGDILASGYGQGVQVADVTGDGFLDVVAGTTGADIGGVMDTGAIYVWGGGAALSGTPPPTATLTVPGAAAGDELTVTQRVGVVFADVSGDGTLDVVSGAMFADIGLLVDVGAAYVWNGGAGLVGDVPPSATLTVPGGVGGDMLGNANGQALQIADVSGDGQPDVVVGSELATVGGVVATGGVWAWEGGAALAGTPAPLASLHVPGAIAGDFLGAASGQAIQLDDVTGDGHADVVAGTWLATVGGVQNAGAVYMWRGGAALTGTLPPFATLTVPGAVTDDKLTFGASQALALADVTGDGVLDVVANAAVADVGGAADAGAVYVWRGGATLVGSPALAATLLGTGAMPLDQLGVCDGPGLQLLDVTADGLDDVVVGARLADTGGVLDAGSIRVWTGGGADDGHPPAGRHAGRARGVALRRPRARARAGRGPGRRHG